MALFRFKTSDSSGKISESLIEGDSQKDALKRLQQRQVVVLDFLGEGTSTAHQNAGLLSGKRFDAVDFTDRLVPLLDAGITLERALMILAESSDNEIEKSLVDDLRRGLHEGRSLSQLIKDRGKLFPRIYASIVEAGEESGALPNVMRELRRFMLSAREMKSFIISSSFYPVIVLCFSVVVILVMLGYIVPKFARVFENSGKEIPAATQFLISCSSVVKDFWWFSFVAALAGIFFWMQLQNDGKVRDWWDRNILSFPFVGKVIHLSNLSRMLRTMSVLMKSGVHLLDSVTISAKVLSNGTLRQSISFLSTDLRRGEKLSVALSKSEYIPKMVVRMLAVGEETGDSEGMLEQVADRYDEDVRKMLKRAISVFEPIIILSLGLVVATIMIVMFLAILNMQNSF